MTSEICLMNRLSIVLAADSATTVSYWNGMEREERYFKGANKIFQLSDFHPVGVMIYDAADIMGVPWEVVIKGFRVSISDKSFNDVEGYANEFVHYVDENYSFIPVDVRNKLFSEYIRQSIIHLISVPEGASRDDRIAKASALHDLAKSARYDGKSPFSELEVKKISEKYKTSIIEKFLYISKLIDFTYLGEADEYVDLITFCALNKISQTGPQTGLVFAGFGDHSVFPELVHLAECQFWDERFVPGRVSKTGPDYETPAIVQGFAQTAMSDTFSLGFSADIWSIFGDAVAEEASKLVARIEDALGCRLDEGKKADFLVSSHESIRHKVMAHALEKHAMPLQRVIGVLPVDEMGELAETLINLQSLKEKVTKRSETVGGPVDVAAITKGEGLVWLKRKHYFDPSINSRYFDRRNR